MRWGIEVYFRKKRQFELLERELKAVAVYMLVAWRIMLLCRLGRACPDLDCEVLFEPSEWKAVYAIGRHRNPNRKRGIEAGFSADLAHASGYDQGLPCSRVGLLSELGLPN